MPRPGKRCLVERETVPNENDNSNISHAKQRGLLCQGVVVSLSWLCTTQRVVRRARSMTNSYCCAFTHTIIVGRERNSDLCVSLLYACGPNGLTYHSLTFTGSCGLPFCVLLSWSLSCVFLMWQFLEAKRSDFLQMLVHHVATLFLLTFSWLSR